MQNLWKCSGILLGLILSGCSTRVVHQDENIPRDYVTGFHGPIVFAQEFVHLDGGSGGILFRNEYGDEISILQDFSGAADWNRARTRYGNRMGEVVLGTPSGRILEYREEEGRRAIELIQEAINKQFIQSEANSSMLRFIQKERGA